VTEDLHILLQQETNTEAKTEDQSKVEEPINDRWFQNNHAVVQGSCRLDLQNAKQKHTRKFIEPTTHNSGRTITPEEMDGEFVLPGTISHWRGSSGGPRILKKGVQFQFRTAEDSA